MSEKSWWKEAIIYQIYPRSFRDSNGDGIGDLGGILEKLDYIERLGINTIWLNPIYQSPNDDNGYDISDYYSIHPEYGTMDQFEELLAALHGRGIRLIMDLVVNHSSDEHEWFVNSKDPREDNPYHDYYFWRKGKNGGPPNNWQSFFGGPAWTYVVEKDAWYLHLFSTKQPDLNWENPRVREEVKDVLRFWLDKGIDGFRMDVIPCISKNLEFADADNSDFAHVIEYVYSNGPRVHEFLQEMHRDVLSKYNIMTVGEGPGISQERANLYVGKSRGELDMIFHLEHMGIDHGPGGRFDPKPMDLSAFKQLWVEWDKAMGDEGWLSVFLDNHDFPRMVSRFGDDQQYRVESAKLLAMLILTMRGTPCIYFGSEIGMTNVSFDSIEDYRDVETRNFYRIFREKGLSEQEFLRLVEQQGRDNVRTPMQWDNSTHAGFTTGTPWIQVNPRYTHINVAQDHKASDSIFHFYQEMIAWRKAHSVLVYGSFTEVVTDHEHLFIYDRKSVDEHYRIVLNLGSEQVSRPELSGFALVFGTHEEQDPDLVGPWEGSIYQKIEV
ncbi:MAG: alpha-glucosidase [Saprospiraceae bacterium]|nr:alpha-glucosidase [Saprospiraceae bacterium]